MKAQLFLALGLLALGTACQSGRGGKAPATTSDKKIL